MNESRISPEVMAEHNAGRAESHARELDSLQVLLAGRGVRLERLLRAAARFELVLAVRGGVAATMRANGPPPPDTPGCLEDALADAAVVQDLTGLTPNVSLQLPDTPSEDLRKPGSLLRRWGIRVSVVKSPPGLGGVDCAGASAFSHADVAVRREAIELNLECIRVGRALGARGLVVGLGERFGDPGHTHARRALDHVIDSLENIYSRLPRDWRLLLPLGSSAGAGADDLLLDWGTVWMVTQELGPQAFGLLDLGAWPSNGTLEQVLARLIAVNRLGGIQMSGGPAGRLPSPQALFLASHELVDAAQDAQVKAFTPRFEPIGLVDGLAPGKAPIEAAIQRALDLHRAHTQALLVDRERLTACQTARDLTSAEEMLRTAFQTDVSPVLAEVRRRRGAALDPLAVYRHSEDRAAAIQKRAVGA